VYKPTFYIIVNISYIFSGSAQFFFVNEKSNKCPTGLLSDRDMVKQIIVLISASCSIEVFSRSNLPMSHQIQGLVTLLKTDHLLVVLN
jgi:hypothetical protein